LNLFKEVRRFNLIPDASIQQYSFRESRVQKQHRIDLSAVTDPLVGLWESLLWHLHPEGKM